MSIKSAVATISSQKGRTSGGGDSRSKDMSKFDDKFTIDEKHILQPLDTE